VTVEGLRAKRAKFRGPIEEREYGRVIIMIVPVADHIQFYQPTHKLAYNSLAESLAAFAL
jgi:hypothetical protein